MQEQGLVTQVYLYIKLDETCVDCWKHFVNVVRCVNGFVVHRGCKVRLCGCALCLDPAVLGAGVSGELSAV